MINANKANAITASLKGTLSNFDKTAIFIVVNIQFAKIQLSN
jgi:hypothetical protein